MIVEKGTDGEDEAWVVYPCPGYVLKFKQVNLGSELFADDTTYKLFLNVCHCEELPSPLEDLDEDEVAKILDSEDPSKYKIPICIGELECVRDNKNENSAKIDVVVNSGFFKKRLETSEFFRNLLLMVASEAIKAKHDITIACKDAIRLKNRKVMGEISAHRIRKKPEKSIIEEVNQETAEEVCTDYDGDHGENPDAYDNRATAKNCRITLYNGQRLEIKCKLSDIDDQLLKCGNFRVKLNDDHLLIHDHFHTVVDIYIPFKMDFRNAKSVLIVAEKTLKIMVPVIY